MAAFTRSLARATLPRRQLSTVAGRPAFAAAARYQAPKGGRSYSSGPEASSGGSSAGTYLFAAAGLAAAAGGAYYFFADDESAKAKKPLDYQQVYNAIADVLEENAEDYDGQGGFYACDFADTVAEFYFLLVRWLVRSCAPPSRLAVSATSFKGSPQFSLNRARPSL
jgi:hypothetical protein